MKNVVRWCLRVVGLVVLAGCFGSVAVAQDNGSDQSSNLSQNGTAAQNSASAQNKAFDHAETGFELTGGHHFVPCESCHVGGQFAGTPTECVACHSVNGRFNATPKPVNHIFSSERCDACHSTIGFQAVPVVDHHEVFGRCENCHNNNVAPGKPIDHIPVQNECADCHSELSWQPVRFSHDKVGDDCVSCHNNKVQPGQPVDHMPVTVLQCGGCHFTSFWAPEKTVDHTLVSENCATCHLGQFAEKSFPQDHIPVIPQCQRCHNTMAFEPVNQVDHQFVIGECRSCHENDKPMTHIDIQPNAPCNACHTSTQIWPSVPVVNHDWVVGTCSHCHDGVTATGQFPGHRPTGTLECNVCHLDTVDFSNHIEL